jgi:hypothetical protein
VSWDVNIWAILVATVVYFALGAVWYMTLGKPWLAALDRRPEDLGSGASAGLYGTTFVLEAVAVTALALLVTNTGATGWASGAGIGALVGFGIWFALMSVTFLYEGRRPALYLIDGGYHAVALTIAGAILGLWR